MAPLHRLWQALEEMPAAAAIMAEWRVRLGADFESAHSLLRPSDQEAGCYPDFAGHGLPYHVVKHGPDDFSAVPPDGGETICLKRADVLIHRLDLRKLAKEIAIALGFSPVFSALQDLPGTWRVGTAAAAGGSDVAVHLVLPAEPDDLRRSIQEITTFAGQSGVIMAPTRRRLKPACEALLRMTKGHFLALGEALLKRDRERWLTSESAANSLAAFLRPSDVLAETPLSDRAQIILVAMIEMDAFDSDSRRSTEEIAAKGLGGHADANALKGVMAELKTCQLVESKTGRGGGCWLTAAGRARAEKLRRA